MTAELVPTVRLVQLRPRHVVAVAVVMAAMVVGAVLTAPGRAAACESLSIPSVGLERCVVDGEQRQIDAGHVVRHTFFSTDSVHWLAGHRTSHGGTFGALTGLSIGDQVAYRGTTYAIAEYRLVNRFQPQVVEDWAFADSPTLVLQTSASGNFVHVWMAQPVVAQMAVPAPAPTTPTTNATPVSSDDIAAVVAERLDTFVTALPTLAWG